MLYEVKAVRGHAEIVSLEIEATDAIDAERLTRANGYDVLGVRKSSTALLPWSRARAGFPVLLFTQELVALLDAGLTLVAAIQTLVEKEDSASIQQVLSRILERLNQGTAFSGALEEFPHIFSKLYIATVRSNEMTGGLVTALTRYAKYRMQMDQVRSKLVSALIYPALLFVVGGGVALFLLFYVVPKFRRIFEDMGTELPFFSRLLVGWGYAVEAHGPLIFLAVIGCALGAGVALGQPETRRKIATKLLALPGLGGRFRIYQFARLYRTLAMLQRSGLPLATALEIATGTFTEIMRPAAVSAGSDIRGGMAFSESMERNALTTPIAYRLLRVGEHSGDMPEMLERIALFYEDELARWVEWFSRLFEPLLMAGIGIVIGLIVVFLYMPIFELAGSIQ